MFKKQITVDTILSSFSTMSQQLKEVLANNNQRILDNLNTIDDIHEENKAISSDNSRATKALDSITNIIGA